MKFKYGEKYPLVAPFAGLASCIFSVTIILYWFKPEISFTVEFMLSSFGVILIAIPLITLLLIYNLIKRLQANNHPEFIELQSDRMVFIADKQTKTVKYDEIEKLWSVELGNDAEAISSTWQASIITTSDQKYDFPAAKFETKQDYDNFYLLLKASCKNLSAK